MRFGTGNSLLLIGLIFFLSIKIKDQRSMLWLHFSGQCPYAVSTCRFWWKTSIRFFLSLLSINLFEILRWFTSLSFCTFSSFNIFFLHWFLRTLFLFLFTWTHKISNKLVPWINKRVDKMNYHFVRVCMCVCFSHRHFAKLTKYT